LSAVVGVTGVGPRVTSRLQWTADPAGPEDTMYTAGVVVYAVEGWSVTSDEQVVVERNTFGEYFMRRCFLFPFLFPFLPCTGCDREGRCMRIE
jgi:hypothetical protein